MRGTILRVLDDITLSPALSSKLQELLPGYEEKRFNLKRDYAANIQERVNSLHETLNFLLEAYPVDPHFTYLTKETISTFAAEARAKCDLTSTDIDKLHKELEKFTGALVSVVRIAWPWSEETKLATKKAIACLNEAEQYLIMSKGRPITATLTPLNFGETEEFLLQIDKPLPACSPELLEELNLLKNKTFPQTPQWFINIKPGEQAYLCTLSPTISPEEVLADLQRLIDSLTRAKDKGKYWSEDFHDIKKNRLPLPAWFNELKPHQREMIKWAKSASTLHEDVKRFRQFIAKQISNPLFKSELEQVISVPQWYSLLPKEQQFFLKYVICNAKKIEDAVFFLPSRLRTLPAPANFAVNWTLWLDENGNHEEIDSKNYRFSHLASRDLVKDKAKSKILRRHTISNLEQVMRYAEPDQEILLQTLISPIKAERFIPRCLIPIFPELPPDKKLYEELREVVFNSKYADRVHQPNHPYNIAKRYYYTASNNPDSIKLIKKGRTDLVDVQTLDGKIAVIEKEIIELKQRNEEAALLSAEQECENLKSQRPKFYNNREELEDLINEYEKVLNSAPLTATVFDYKGRELCLSSLEQLKARAKKMFRGGSCVSAKDRKAVERIHTLAMLIYKRYYGIWPCFTDGGINRKKFVDIVVDLYITRHQQELANQNAPGAAGIKTPYWYFPEDICTAIEAKLGEPRTLENDDRLATDNEVKYIFTDLNQALIPESQLKATLITGQIEEELCKDIYSALYHLIDQKQIFEVSTYTKIARSIIARSPIFTKVYSELPPGIQAIKDLMHSQNSGKTNVARMEKIINIVHDIPLVGENDAAHLVYETLLGLCHTNPERNLLDYIAKIIELWAIRLNRAINENKKSSPTHSDDEAIASETNEGPSQSVL